MNCCAINWMECKDEELTTRGNNLEKDIVMNPGLIFQQPINVIFDCHYYRAATLEQTIENQDAEILNLTASLETLKTSNKVRP